MGSGCGWNGLELTTSSRPRRGHPTLQYGGRPGELLLFLFGRSAADVEIFGPPMAIETLNETPFGM